jgi:hypothetical protein
MKGIIFTEFLDMVEGIHGYGLVDELLNECDLKSGGIYTAIGTYEHKEMVQLFDKLSEKIEIPMSSLLKSFGHYLFGTFRTAYPSFFESAHTAFSFLESIEKYIHEEVLKLYPDAQLPKFQTRLINENCLEMIYLSDRGMADFAEGLIEKTLEHYKESAVIEKKNIEESGRQVKFIITKS